MELNIDTTKIFTDDTGRETTLHGNDEFPLQCYYEDVWAFDFHCMDWHWHPEIEIIYLESGSVTLLAGDSRYLVHEGEAAFINSHVLHRFEADASNRMPNMVFLPTLLAPTSHVVYQKYIRPVLESSCDCCVLSPAVTWQNEVLKRIQEIFELWSREQRNELRMVRALLEIWDGLYENLPMTAREESNNTLKMKQQMRSMLEYIHKNYSKKIALADIAGVVPISKSGALKLFKQYLENTPVNYLNDYRLKCAAKLLRDTRSSVTDISAEVGFESNGYFSRRFKLLYGLTPGEYRKQNN